MKSKAIKLFFICLLTIIGTCSFAQVSGIVVAITGVKENYSHSPMLIKKSGSINATSILLKEGDKILENDWLLTDRNTEALINVEDVIVKIRPFTQICLFNAYYQEASLRELWNLNQGAINVKFDSSSKQDPKVGFTTKNGLSVLITGTEFDLNENGKVSVIKGEVALFDRDSFRGSNGKTNLSKARKEDGIVILRAGQSGSSRGDILEAPLKKSNLIDVTPEIFNKPDDQNKPDGNNNNNKNKPEEPRRHEALPPDSRKERNIVPPGHKPDKHDGFGRPNKPNNIDKHTPNKPNKSKGLSHTGLGPADDKK